MKVKNDKELKFVKDYVVFNKNTSWEYWEKKSDLEK